MLFRNGTLIIDMINFLAGSEPAWLFAELDEGYEDYDDYRGDGGRKATLEPGCSGYIHYANNVRAFYNGSKDILLRPGFELSGTAGWIHLIEGMAEIGTPQGTTQIMATPMTYSDTAAAVMELIHVMQHGGETISPPREARKALEIILGFLASQARGNTRVDLPLRRRNTHQ